MENEEQTKCPCNDPACDKEGEKDEETGHIEDCPCGECHAHYH